jgi:hypothetical protein
MKRVDYQNPQDNLEAVQEKRNAEIRAYGQAVLAEADSHLPTTTDDWDVLDELIAEEATLQAVAPQEPELEPETPEEPVEALKPETAAQKKKREAEEASSKP